MPNERFSASHSPGDSPPPREVEPEAAAPLASTPLLDKIFREMTDAAGAAPIDPSTFESFGKVLAAHGRDSDLTMAGLQDLVAAATASLPLPDGPQRREMLLAVAQSLWDDPVWNPRLQTFWKKLGENFA